MARALYNLSEVADEQKYLGRALRLSSAARALFEAVGSPLSRYPIEMIARLLPLAPGVDAEAWRAEAAEMPLAEAVARLSA